MKKIFMLLALIALGGFTAEAQQSQYVIPKFKKKKEVKEYELAKENRPYEIYFGGTVNFALGLQDHINFTDHDYQVGYNDDVSLMGGSASIGAAYKLGKHFTTGLEAGALFHDSGITIPLSGVFKYYYGPQKWTKPYRFYNFAQVGPQFFLDGDSKTIGMLAGAGGGIRFAIANALRLELQVGYQMNMRRPKVYNSAAYDVPIKGVHYKEYVHLAQFGVNIYIL